MKGTGLLLATVGILAIVQGAGAKEAESPEMAASISMEAAK